MKRTRFAPLAAALLCSLGPQTRAETPARLDDLAWAKESADSLARCAGTYRGAADALRAAGRDERADYLDGVATGALFAAYVLLTSPQAVAADVLGTVDTHVYLEALAQGATTNFKMLAERSADPAAPAEALRGCTATTELQSSVLQTLTAKPTPAAASARADDRIR